MAQQFHGVIPPAVTPLTADQELDLLSFTRSINRMIDAGVNGIFTLGSSGEVAFSTDARREEIIRAAIDIVDGAYMAGADGSVPGLANVEATAYVRMWNAYRKGDWGSVRTEQDKMAALMRITSVVQGVQGFGAGVGAFKTALALLGVFDTNQMPNPVAPLAGENVERIAAVLKDCGLPLARTPLEVSESTAVKG